MADEPGTSIAVQIRAQQFLAGLKTANLEEKLWNNGAGSSTGRGFILPYNSSKEKELVVEVCRLLRDACNEPCEYDNLPARLLNKEISVTIIQGEGSKPDASTFICLTEDLLGKVQQQLTGSIGMAGSGKAAKEA